MTEEQIRIKAEEWLQESKKLSLITDKNVEQIKKTISEIVAATENVSNKRTNGYLACANNFYSKALNRYDAFLQTKKNAEDNLKAQIKKNTERIEKNKTDVAERMAKAKESKIKEEIEKELVKEEVKEEVEKIKKKRGRPSTKENK